MNHANGKDRQTDTSLQYVNCVHCARKMRRGERVNGGHLKEMQNKTKSIRKVETLYKLAFSPKGLFLKYAV
jgi:hypothetical protein